VVCDGDPRRLRADDRAAPEGLAGWRRAGLRPADQVRLGPRAAAHAQIVNLLADVIADHPVPAMVLTQAVGTLYDVMVAAGPAAAGMIDSSRRRLLALIGAGDADSAAAEMEHHLRGLHLMARLPGTAEPGGIAV
jgi:hypothetical protein